MIKINFKGYIKENSNNRNLQIKTTNNRQQTKIEQPKDAFTSSINKKEEIAKKYKRDPLKNAVFSGFIGAGIGGLFTAFQYLKSKKIDKEILLSIPGMAIGLGLYTLFWDTLTNYEIDKTLNENLKTNENK